MIEIYYFFEGWRVGKFVGFRQAITLLLDKCGNNPFRFSIGVFVFGVVLSVILYFSDDRLKDGYFSGIFVEFAGMLFDIAVFGLLIAFLTQRRSVRIEIERLQEIIDDFKKWQSEEAKFRIAGAIRRINKLGQTKIDFRGIILSDFVFAFHGIKNLNGSVFAAGHRFDDEKSSGTVLTNVSFRDVCAKECDFSVNAAAPFLDGLRGVNLDFFNAQVGGSKFENANLEWDSVRVDLEDWGEFVSEDDEDQGIYIQTYFPAFDRADLDKVSFVGSRLKCADFRGAKNIMNADFTGVCGLDTCFFDEGVLDSILEKRNQK
ncbi:pentapeptide repeat-containing protein [Thalassospira alkalitolerans]|uniref:pentapeptide repeat-containing protein n=1 Tax=Thalassospira alkalitolerans TaxID=1293890 RepID=UPI00111C691A|nr:pentapeptide repeat-containing protein [Thalassospira alkalitolerans]